MEEGGTDVVAGHSVACPCTAFFRRLVDENCGASWADRVGAEVEGSTGETVMS